MLAALLIPAGASAQQDDDAQAVHWQWRRVQTWEAIAAPTVIAGSLALRYLGPSPEPSFYGGILFDDAIRDSISLGQGARDTLDVIADVSFYGSMVYSGLDPLVVGLVHENAWDVSWNMFVMNAEAFAIVGAVTWGAQVFVGRPRPGRTDCDTEQEVAADPECADTDEGNRSFISGHFAAAVANAGLTCHHHLAMPLYGGGAQEVVVCGAMIVLAGLNGYGRIVNDNHYPTDAVLGLGLGLFAGVAVPYWLHYSEPDTGDGVRDDAPDRPGMRAVLLPTFSTTGAGLQLQGQF
jgi:membrane-associated phospholipid phosphatase